MEKNKSQIDKNTEIAEILHAQKESIEFLLKTNQSLKDRLIEKSTRISLVLTTCDEHEQNHDYSISTDSVRAMLTAFEIKQ